MALNHSFAWSAVLVLALLIGKAAGRCRTYPFDIDVDIIPKEEFAGRLGCTLDDWKYMATQISKDINYVIMRSLKNLGVIASETKICKDGQLLAKHVLERTGQRKLYWHKFSYRGSGACTMCSSDNRDYRNLLLTTNSSEGYGVNSSLVDEDLLAFAQDAVQDEINLLVNSTDLRDLYRPFYGWVEKERKNHSNQVRSLLLPDEETRHLNSYSMNVINKRTNGFRRRGGPRKKKFRATNHPTHASRGKNRWGFRNYEFKNNKYFRIGFFVDGKGKHRYYYKYKLKTLDFFVLGEILSEILTVKFGSLTMNEDLCTFAKLHKVDVTLTKTWQLGRPC